MDVSVLEVACTQVKQINTPPTTTTFTHTITTLLCHLFVPLHGLLQGLHSWQQAHSCSPQQPAWQEAALPHHQLVCLAKIAMLSHAVGPFGRSTSSRSGSKW
jgi:hypothetical protein